MSKPRQICKKTQNQALQYSTQASKPLYYRMYLCFEINEIKTIVKKETKILRKIGKKCLDIKGLNEKKRITSDKIQKKISTVEKLIRNLMGFKSKKRSKQIYKGGM